MKPDALIKKLRDARSDWVGLPHPDFPDLKVKVERPAESEFYESMKVTPRAQLVAEVVADWAGMSEAVFLGAAVGSTDEIPFDEALWAFVSKDRLDWIEVVTQKATEMVSAHLVRKSEDQKN